MEEKFEVAPLNSRESPDADALYCEECLRADRSFSDIPNIAPDDDNPGFLVLSLKADTADIKPDTTCPSCRDFLSILDEVDPDARYFQLKIGMSSFYPEVKGMHTATVDTSTNIFSKPDISSYLLRRSDYPTRLRSDATTHTEGKDLPTILIKSWLHTCEHEHEGCRPNSANDLDMPLYLIDVVEECITLKPVSNVRYIALSYVWGNAKSTNLTSGNMEELRKPRSLSFGSHVATVPQTIRDAMRLTADLDVRYLWVDCLCLIQNDPNLSFYLNRMHLIYTNAFLTIVVVNKDNANGGITGYDARSTGRILPGKVINYPNYVLGMEVVTTPVFAFGFPWCSRAWTLQESFSSRRVLVINDRIFLYCMGDNLEEGSNFGFKISFNLSDSMRDLRPTLCQASLIDRDPNWHAYKLAAQSFAPCALSYDQDTLKAFLGVINFYTSLDDLQSEVHTRLLYGHPVCTLPRALLWSSSTAILERRMLLRQDGSFVMPSWSWMAWRHNCQKTGWISFGAGWPTGDDPQARELQVPTVIFAQCGICLQNHQMTSEKCRNKVSPELVNPEYLDPYLYIKAQKAQFGVSCQVKKYDKLVSFLIPLGTMNDTENDFLGEITYDQKSSQLPRGEAGAFDFIGISYVEAGYIRNSGRPEIQALCVTPVNGRPGVFERLGVATIFKDAWDQTAQFDENIILG